MKTKLTKTEKETLALAAQLIMDFGLAKGSFGNEECGFCALGAIHYAVNMTRREYSSNIFRALEEKIGLHYSISAWNDDFRTSKEDVVGALQDLAR